MNSRYSRYTLIGGNVILSEFLAIMRSISAWFDAVADWIEEFFDPRYPRDL